jgi:hypothetical protein
MGADGVGDDRIAEQSLTDRFSAGKLETVDACAELQERTTAGPTDVPDAARNQCHNAEARDDPQGHAETIASRL